MKRKFIKALRYGRRLTDAKFRALDRALEVDVRVL